MFKGIGEFNIICSDIDASLKFYTEVLGFEVAAIIEEEGGAIHLKKFGQLFLLLPIAQAKPIEHEYGTVPTMSFDLVATNLDQTVEHLREHNVQFASEWEAGGDYVFIRDPDGLVVEITRDGI